MTKVVRLLIINILSLFIFCACDSSSQPDSSPKGNHDNRQCHDNTKLYIGTTPTFDCLPLFIAEDAGIFAKHNLHVDLKHYTSAMDCDTAFIGGSISIMASDLIKSEWLKQKKQCDISYFSTTNAHWQLITNKNSRINKLNQFGDKIIAISHNSVPDMIATLFASSSSNNSEKFIVPINDVYIRYKMLNSALVDGACLTEPWSTLSLKNGHKSVYNSKDDNIDFGVIIVNNKYAHDDNIKKMMSILSSCYNEACDSINKNHISSYSNTLAKRFNMSQADIQKLHDIKFRHIVQPSVESIKRAQEIFNKIK